MENREQNEIEFDLLQMLGYLLKRAWIIVLAMAVFAVAGFVISKKNEVPKYTAACRIFVYRTDSGVSYNDVLTSLYLVKDCEVILTNLNVSSQIVENLELPISPSTISDKVKVTVKDDTHVLELKYTDTDPKRAAAILNELCDLGEQEVKKHIKDASYTIMYYAEVPTVPTPGTAVRDTILGAAIGAVLAAAVLIVIFLADDTIRSEDDVVRYLGLSTLTAVTMSPDLASDSKTAELARKKAPAVRVRKH